MLTTIINIEIWCQYDVRCLLLRNMRRVREMINKKLKLISMVMRWTIGRRNLRSVMIRDQHLFKFIRVRKLDFVNFN